MCSNHLGYFSSITKATSHYLCNITDIEISIVRVWTDFIFNVLFCGTVDRVDFVCVVFQINIGVDIVTYYNK